MNGKAFQYYAFLMNYDPDDHKMDLLLLPARSSATRIKPLQRAKIQFTLENNRLRPFKYLVKGKNSSDYRRPKEITTVLRKAKGIIIPADDVPDDYELFEEYFKSFNINEPTVRRICRLCMIDQNKVTILPKGKEYLVSGRQACYECAKDELNREIKAKEMNFGKHGRNHFYRVLRKQKNVDRVAHVFDYDFHPSKQPELTLFDTLGNVDDMKQALPIDHAAIPGKLKHIFKRNGIKRLLPIQTKALDAGLLKGQDLLVVAGTSSGKTLIGELAGIDKALQGKTMLYLSPLVALTNQKYEDFKKRYSPDGLRTAIRVGMSKIDVGKEERYIIDSSYKGANIITATYEAFDLILRNGNAPFLGDLGTVIIDEIQLLNDKERGPEIDGLITRIRTLFPKAQIIGLSATVGNPEEIAKDLGLHLLVHEARPIPLERHVIITQDQDEKERYLAELIRHEFHRKSSYGYHGQTIVFTNSRKHCYELASKFNRWNLRTIVYHSGLTFRERKRAESGFANGKYSAIITTAALGAGVDFPASQVIFENLAMGIEWLTVAEFHQMIGRAGRLGYHDRGKVYLLVEPNRKYHSKMELTEDSVAFSLLNEPIEDIEPLMEGERQLEQILACIVALKEPSLKDIVKIYNQLLGVSEPLKYSLGELQDLQMINIFEEGPRATNLGQATIRSFLPPTQAEEIKRKLRTRSPLGIAIGLEPFTSIYLNAKIQAEIEKTLKGGYIGSNLFSGSLLEYMSNALERTKRLPQLVIDTFSKWQQDIFDCECRDNPWCGCGEQAISRIIVKMRLQNKNLRKISTDLTSRYLLYAYPGDIYRWFDTLIHHLRAVAKLALVFNERKTMKLALNTIKLIEKPWLANKLKKSKKKKNSK